MTRQRERELLALRVVLMNTLSEITAEKLEDEFIRDWVAEEKPLMTLNESQDLWMELNTNKRRIGDDIMSDLKAQFFSVNRYNEQCDEEWSYFSKKQAEIVQIIDDILTETGVELNKCERRIIEGFAYGYVDEQIEVIDDNKWIKRIKAFGIVCTVFIAFFISQSFM